MTVPLRRAIAHPLAAAMSISALFAALLPTQTRDSADRAEAAVDSVSATAATGSYVPLTETERFHQFLTGMANPLALVTSAASAGFGQWRDRPRKWREGGEGYGLRYASLYGEHIALTTLMFGTSSLFHEDNRYVRSESSGFGSRVGHALGSAFLARGEDGTRRLSFSRITAVAGAALISRLWQPPSNRTFRSAGVNFGTSMGVTMGFNVVREFWPHK